MLVEKQTYQIIDGVPTLIKESITADSWEEVEKYENEKNKDANTEENKNLISLEGDFVDNLRIIDSLELKRGDQIIITFKDEAQAKGRLTGICFSDYYKNISASNKDREFKLYFDYMKDDNEEYRASLKNIKSIEITKRSTRSKKVLLENNVMFKNYIK